MQEIAYRISRKANLMRARLADAFSPAEITPSFEGSECGHLSFTEARQHLQEAAQQLVPSRCSPAIHKALLANYPGYVETLATEADAICRHAIPVFRTAYDFGAEINWHKDLVSGHEWPRVFFGKIRPIDLADDSDIKFPWELSCFRHAVTLGAAFWVTGREKYAEEFAGQVSHWVRQNPPNRGVNWLCAMEVAIRAANLIWAFSLMREARCLSDDFFNLFLNLLRAHGEHIRRHLENRMKIRGNHYIADLAGLLYIASFCPFFRHSRKWSRFCINELKSELRDQVLADGTDFEGSISYHRLVAEMLFHAAYIAAKAQGPPGEVQTPRELHGVAVRVFGSQFLHRLETMFDYILHYTRPDGLAPQVGDNDSGRFVMFPSPGQGCTDHRHLLALGGEFFDRDDFRWAGQGSRAEAIWLLGGEVASAPVSTVEVASRAFQQGGIHILRHHQEFCLVHCGPLGCAGKGAHSHNDNLSFELCAGGKAFIVDPGTYTYSRDPVLRNLFRSTAYHNTLVVDGREQNEISQADLFLLRSASISKTISWVSDAQEDAWVGEMLMTAGDGSECRHVRKIQLNKSARRWILVDEVQGGGTHSLDWFFHLHPEVVVQLHESGILLSTVRGHALVMTMQGLSHHDITMENSWYSPHYGARVPASRIHFTRLASLPFTCTFEFFRQDPESQLSSQKPSSEQIACDSSFAPERVFTLG